MNTRHLRPADLAGKRWRGLVRESSEKQAEAWSPERQRSDLRRAADELGLTGMEPLFYERVGSGEEEGVSELAQALADGRRGEFDVLLVLHTSRFARNRAEAVRMKAEFKKAGIVIYFVAQRLISGTYQGGLTEGINEVIDEQENETRRMWVAGGLRERHLAGRWVGTVPFGYRRVMVDRPDGSRGWDGALQPDPETAPLVREIFKRAAQGQGTRVIAAAIAAAGGRTTTGRVFRPMTVQGILSNPVYTGRLIRYRRRASGQYYDHDSQDGYADLGARLPAIIDGTLFDKVNRLRRSRRFADGTSRPRAYPLSKVLRCARCGARMTGCYSTARIRYYRCDNRAVRTCDAPYIRADVAEGAFTEWLGSLRLPDDWRAEIAKSTVIEASTAERDRRRALEGRLAKLRDLYSWDHISKDDYLRESAEIKASLGTMTVPSIAGIEAVADVLRDHVVPAWAQAPSEMRAAIAGMILKSIEVRDAQVETLVVNAGLRPLIDLCTQRSVTTVKRGSVHALRYSA